MSTASSPLAGSPVGAFRSGDAPGVRDAVRSMLALLLIEIRRSQGYWLLPLMVGLGIYMNRNMNWEGVVLWPNLSKWTMQSYVIVGPLAAALAAWLVDRDRRRRIEGLVGTMATSPFRRDVVLLATAVFWGLVGYALVAAWYGFEGVREATWGGPDVALIAVGALGIVILAGVGFIVGRLVRGKFSPIIAVAVAFFLSAAPEFIQTWMNPDSGMQTRLAIRPLTPWGLIGDREPTVFEKFPAGYLGAALTWLAGAVAITIVVISLMRSWRRNWTAWAALAVSCAIALFGANRVMRYDGGHGYLFEDDLRIPFTWSCETTAVVEVCVHPAYESKLDESARRIDAFVAPLAGLPGVPARWEQSSPFGDEQGEVGTFYPGSQFVNTHEIGFAIFPPDDDVGQFSGGPFSATQSVILSWLSGRVDPQSSQFGMFEYPAELLATPVPMGDMGSFTITVDAEAEAHYAREIPAATDRFAALSPEEQRAWLEANWDALRAGELTLDALP